MTKLAKQLIMKVAWNLAKNGAKRFGGKAVEYLSESMKTAWKVYKHQKSRFDNDFAGIAPWFIKKELSLTARTVNHDSQLKIVRKTEKAALIECTIYAMNHKNIIDRCQFWAPKSVIF